jgi:diadenosine tetraphosphate (Ap4A) HIT family hydrolase
MNDVLCYFCNRTKFTAQLVYEDDLAIVLNDNFPVSKGHTLIVPKAHIANIFELPDPTYSHLFKLVKINSEILMNKDLSIGGFNIGVNQGVFAGQTVMHVHIHLIPRRSGDSNDPRGGVRWVLPDKAKYWD